MKHSKNVQIALDILKNGVGDDVATALLKMADEYSMAWMYKSGDNLFPSTGKNVEGIERRDIIFCVTILK